MVINKESIGKGYNRSYDKAKINLDLNTLNIFCRYILQDPRLIRMEHLVQLRRLLNIIDPSTYENDPDKVKRINYLYKALEARLDYNLTDRELILTHINGGISFPVDFLDYDNLAMDKANVIYCHKLVEDTLKFSFFYNDTDILQDLITQFKTVDISKRASIVMSTEQIIDRIKNNFRKCHVEQNLNDVTFSLEDGTFESAVTDTYNMVTNPSRRLFTGMQGLNELIGGGFESGRVYMLLGVAGVGKSLTLLNIITQLKKYNTGIRGKDPTKTPCIVLLTMENTVVETITRMFDMVVDNSMGMGNYELGEVIYKMRTEGGLAITETSPLDIVVRYKPNRSVSTDYLYTLYDDLMDQGKEPVCFIQDHIKRIRSIDGNSDLRLELGDIVNEFKVFAAEKDIPVVTVSHLNREATRILEEAARKGNQESGKLIGKSNTGESLLMIDNLDCGITISRDYDKDGVCHMCFHRIKMRDRGSARDYIAYPFLLDNPIRLVEDFGGVPQFKESLHNVDIKSNGVIKLSGAASIAPDKLIDVIDTKESMEDNTFNKETFNLAPISADNNDEFKLQADKFDEEISQLIIEEFANQQAIETQMRLDNGGSMVTFNQPVKPAVSFGEPFKVDIVPYIPK